ncbi:hypothetical protein BD324DRAFT_611551 [Kockovaella imperatae]|uniref:Uncharacterized protein n=1 Tax=Kockovaella imperatae TaxID=4999 RepID=A0A1Y1URL9_9TREE|nr:hypothetical protein BD324DRAFT_611551 [Kockovaella imperatae]ORX40619.1 hypothetical protein BD324DRAFT_611551 [Kockovaella imperatae]
MTDASSTLTPQSSASLQSSLILESSSSSMTSVQSPTSFGTSFPSTTASTGAVYTPSSPANATGAGNSQDTGRPCLDAPTLGDDASTASSAGGAQGSNTNIGAIAGGIAGGVLAIVLATILIWWLFCRGRRRASRAGHVDSLVESKPLDLADAPSGQLPTYVQSQVDNGEIIAQTIYYRSPTSGPENEAQVLPMIDTRHPFLVSGHTTLPTSNYPYSINPPSSAASEPHSHGSQTPFWMGRSPPATPSSRQGAASRTPSVPDSATFQYSLHSRDVKSPTSLPYRNSTPPSIPSSAAQSTSVASDTSHSYRKLYRIWDQRNRTGDEIKE